MVNVRIDPKVKLELLRCQRKLMSKRETVGILRSKKITVSRQVVEYWIDQYKCGKMDNDCEEKTNVLRQITSNDVRNIEQYLQEDPTRSSKEIYKHLKEKGAQISLSTTKRAIRLAGFTNTSPRYCQLIRHVNKEKRVNFCEALLQSGEDFSDVIFSDECTVQLHTNKTTFYRPIDSVRTSLPKPKHPVKIHIWAAISKRGASSVLVFDGIMNGEFFTNAILKDTLVPFIERKFPDCHRFQQDNDPKHRSRVAQDFMANNNINWWKEWPSESADLNPIEMVWNQLKRYLARQDLKSKDDLVRHVHIFWKTFMTTEQCKIYIDHLYKVVPVCILNGGKATRTYQTKYLENLPLERAFNIFAKNYCRRNSKRQDNKFMVVE